MTCEKLNVLSIRRLQSLPPARRVAELGFVGRFARNEYLPLSVNSAAPSDAGRSLKVYEPLNLCAFQR